MKKYLCAAALASAILFGATAFAQPPAQEGWSVSVGGGALVSPTYKGDDAYRLSLLPDIRIAHGDHFFASVNEGVGYNLINSGVLRAGPIARIEFSRQEDGDQPFAITGERTTDLIGLGDVSTTIELGGFAEVDIGPVTAGVEARHGVNGHEGFVGDVELSYGGRFFPFGPPLIYSFGPRARFVNGSYNSAYFDVNPVQSLASGLPVFDADGGLYSVGVGASVILPLSRDNASSIVFIAGYDRLTGDAADSSLVRLRGSRNQATVGMFFSYRLF